MSTVLDIFASIIQGSALGPASYVANAADLTTVTPGNAMFKYADDTYIIIPARNSQSRGSELDNVSKWALANNLRLNKAKCVEIVFADSCRKHGRRSMGGQGDMSPLLFEVEGTPCVLSPLLFRG